MPSDTHTNITRTNILLLQLGVGQVGDAVIESVQLQADGWRARFGVDVRYCSVADSSGFVVPAAPEHALLPDAIARVLQARASGQPFAALSESFPTTQWREVLARAILDAGRPERLVVVDCASGRGTTEMLLAARAVGAHAVLCNKDPLTGPYHEFQALVGVHTGGSLRLSATVGAGLPIASAVTAAMATGDAVTSLSAVASGSLGQLCAAMSAGKAFPDALQDAIAAGYCEPDPRRDLSGNDVARKLLILARLAGRSVEMENIAVESLIPPVGDTLSIVDFMTALPTWRDHLCNRFATARKTGRVLRYVGTMDASGTLHASLRELDPDDPLAQGSGPENVFVLHTGRYQRHPLMIAGPGAGIAVTAGAVVGDILRAVGGL